MRTPTDPKELGRQGEQRAATWYQDNGFAIVARNWRCEHGEIDVIAANDHVLVFCEVKSRASTRWGAPAEAVTPTKQRRLRRVASAWLQASTTRRKTVRFDVASYVHGALSVIEDAF